MTTSARRPDATLAAGIERWATATDPERGVARVAPSPPTSGWSNETCS